MQLELWCSWLNSCLCGYGCLRRPWHGRGLAFLDAERTQRRKMLQRHDAQARSRAGLVEVVASMLSGQSWRFCTMAEATGAELRARVAAVANIPEIELVLICRSQCVGDEITVLSLQGRSTGSEAASDVRFQESAPLQIQVIRARKPLAFSCSGDTTLKVWDLQRGACAKTLRGHQRVVSCVEVDWGARRALSGSWDCSLKLWDLESAACVETLYGHCDIVMCVSVEWRTQRACSGAGDKALKLWDLDRAACTATCLGHAGGISGVSLNWVSGQALTSSYDSTLKLWDLSNGHCSSTLKGHANGVSCLAVDWRALRALSGSWDGSLRLWDVARSVCLATLQGHAEPVLCLAADWGSSRALSGSCDCTLRLWDLVGASCIRILRGHRDPVGCVALNWTTRQALSGAGELLVNEVDGAWDVKLVSTIDNSLKLWDLDEAACVMTLLGHSGTVACVSVDISAS